MQNAGEPLSPFVSNGSGHRIRSLHPSLMDGLGNMYETESDEDIALLNAVASCALQDIAELQATDKGKSKAGVAPSDAQLALEFFAEEANALLASTRDMEIALSLEKAMRIDEPAIQELCIAEERASRDREMAIALSHGRPPPPRPPTPIPPETSIPIVDDTLNMSESQSESDDDNEDGTDRGASSSNAVLPVSTKMAAMWSAPRPFGLGAKGERNNCVICSDKIKGVEFNAPCGHYYDRSCLVELYETITRDEELFPPRCCQREFDFSTVRRHLPLQLATLFLEKAREYRTADRVYCHRPTCSAFLGGKTSHVTAIRCPRCSSHTCGSCKSAIHPGKPCNTQEDEDVLALAEENGWKRCPGCNHLVELTHGCFHMTCRCRYQFCYLCTARWKTCTCPQWEENRLLVAANDRVQRQIREEPQVPQQNAPAVVPNFNALLAQEVQRLREDHDCRHAYWQYRAGGGRCEHCNFMLPNFLLRCTGCRTLACVRCRRNRL